MDSKRLAIATGSVVGVAALAYYLLREGEDDDQEAAFDAPDAEHLEELESAKKETRRELAKKARRPLSTRSVPAARSKKMSAAMEAMAPEKLLKLLQVNLESQERVNALTENLIRQSIGKNRTFAQLYNLTRKQYPKAIGSGLNHGYSREELYEMAEKFSTDIEICKAVAKLKGEKPPAEKPPATKTTGEESDDVDAPGTAHGEGSGDEEGPNEKSPSPTPEEPSTDAATDEADVEDNKPVSVEKLLAAHRTQAQEWDKFGRLYGGLKNKHQYDAAIVSIVARVMVGAAVQGAHGITETCIERGIDAHFVTLSYNRDFVGVHNRMRGQIADVLGHA